MSLAITSLAAHAFACLALLSHAAAFGDFVARRGSEPGLTGTITRIDDAGVAIRSTTGAEHSITWDRIRDVTTADPSVQRSVDEHRQTAEFLWRARTRVERGDTALAEPLFERLFAQYRGRNSETALIVAEGLLRCRLARAANEAALIPALEAARLRRKNFKTVAYGGLNPIFDEATALCTLLPPAWAPSSGLARVEVELKSYDAGGDTAVAALAGLYRAAARQQLSLAPEEAPELAEGHVGVALMRMLVGCGSESSEPRASARTALLKRVADLSPWEQAWARFAIGRSLLLESGVGQQQAGLVSLAHLPASFQREQPYLAAMSLALLCVHLQRMGEADEATALRNELIRLFPNHPALTLLEAAPAAAQVSARHTSPDHQFFERLKEPA